MKSIILPSLQLPPFRLQTLRCRFDRHRPEHGTVFWDGLCYVGQCVHCGTGIRRMSKTRWRRDEPQSGPGLA
ncbi:hypothetical protein [Novosphingobium sp.]|uniref:hypothetical protein n=1 Tax=Novosphingobium sp. TaxID=1874826 RepID=UPI002FE411FC